MRNFLVIAISASAIAACATLPNFGEKNYAYVEDLLVGAECELMYAAKSIIMDKNLNELVNLNKIAASVDAELRVINTTTADGEFSLVIPFSSAKFTLGSTGNLTNKNTRKAIITNKYNISELSCLLTGETISDSVDEPLTEVFKKPVRQPEKLIGVLGLGEWLEQAVLSAAAVNRFPHSLTYEVEFDIVGNAKAGPKITDTLSAGQIITGSADLDKKRQRAHNIKVTIVAASESGTGIRDVAQKVTRDGKKLTTGVRTITMKQANIDPALDRILESARRINSNE